MKVSMLKKDTVISHKMQNVLTREAQLTST